MEHHQNLFNKAVEAYQASQFDAAAQSLSEIVGEDTKNWQAWRMLGFTLVAAGDFEKAVHAFQAAIQGNLQDPDNFFGLGLAQQALEDHAGAINSFERALQYNPKHPAVKSKMVASYTVRGRQLLEAANLMGAEQYFEKAYKYSQSPESYQELLEYYDKAGQSGKAALVQQEWAARH